MSESGKYSVSLTKNDLLFSSAHFITFKGHRCETLHGHNYRAAVTLEGDPDEESWFVFDFIVLKATMQRLCGEIDHKVLLPLNNPKLTIREEGESVAVDYEGKRRYVFPRIDCALLPVPNTTVEMIAQLLAGRLRCELENLKARGITAIVMEVEETFGQSATFRMVLGPRASGA